MYISSHKQFLFVLSIIIVCLAFMAAVVMRALGASPSVIIALLVSASMLCVPRPRAVGITYPRKSWVRNLDTVLIVERQSVPYIKGPDDIVLQNLPNKLWWNHAVHRAVRFTHHHDADTLVVAFDHQDNPIGMFCSDSDNWFAFGAGIDSRVQ